ncbi:hypothetical protein U1Q18_004909 [Sarracenia purpurea var. burkii]
MFALAALSWIPRFKRAYHQTEDDTTGESALESRPCLSPSLVQIPVQFIAGSIKERLPVIKYDCFLDKLSIGECKEEEEEEEEEEGWTCAICLKCMSPSDEVRELSNCVHGFHRECLDGWVDHGQITCPLCRSKLMPAGEENGEDELANSGGDPWRRERMIYLFGQDLYF